MEKEVLRSQYDGKKSKWRIAKKTNSGAGGWKSFGSGAIYATQSEAEQFESEYVDYFLYSE